MKASVRTISAGMLLLIFLVTAAAQVSDKNMSVVQASEIMAMIERGTPLVIYDHIIVKGDLDLNKRYYGAQSREPSVNSSISILDSAVEGSVNLDNITFLRRVTFLNTTFEKAVTSRNSKFKSSAAFINSRFNKSVDFSYSIFEGSASFHGSGFGGPANFIKDVFAKSADFTTCNFANFAYFQGSILNNCQFSNTKFCSNAVFSPSDFLSDSNLSDYRQWIGFDRTVFLSKAYFRGSRFTGDVNFGDSLFNDTAEFESCNFEKISNFRESKFNQEANYARSIFQDDATFKNSRFEGTARFIDSVFRRHADFTGSSFMGVADFTNASFEMRGPSDIAPTNFQGTTFNKMANFCMAKFGGDANFAYCTFHDDRSCEERSNALASWGSRLNKCLNVIGMSLFGQPFRSASFGKAIFGGKADFQGSTIDHMIDFNDARFTKLLIKWDNIYPLDDLSNYPHFIKNYKNISWFDDASDCFYDYRVQIRNKQPLGYATKTIDFAAEKAYGYGMKPLYPLMLSLLVVLIFGFIYRRYINESGPLLGYISFSLAVFISGTKLLGFENVSKPKERQAAIAYDVEKWLGLILQGLIILTISKTVLDVVNM